MPMGAAAMLVLSVAGIGALDFQNATMLRGNLQDALDTATLAVARSEADTNAEMRTLGLTLIRQGLHKSAKDARLENVRFTEDEGVIYAQATLSFKPMLGGFFTGDRALLTVKSQVAPGDSLEVALVLDNTYSMQGTRIATLKTSATNFVNILERAAGMSRDDDALKISLVPFSTTVNVGSTYRTASWMDTAGLSPIHHEPFDAPTAGGARPTRFTLFSRLNTTWAGCVESRPAPYDVQDTEPTTGTPGTLFVPYFAPDEYDVWDPNYSDNRYWVNNYVPDDLYGTSTWKTRQRRVEKYDQSPASTASIGSGYSRGPNYECILHPLVRLTTDGEKVKKAISELTIAGDTNIPVGLAWGWHTLSPKGPFKDGVAYGTHKTKKIAVLMTDGQNMIFDNNRENNSIYSAIGYIGQNRVGITDGTPAQRRAALDARLSLLCRNMKAQGILIYTIRLEVEDSDYQVLRNCASAPEMFHDVKQASQLNAAFTKIADDIQKLRIAR
ncbi:MAG TPA: TadE/TadG family type IV pilus assembly protein [Caulobacteraceae bacterium]